MAEVARTTQAYLGHIGRGERELACELLTERAQRELARNFEVGAAARSAGAACLEAAGAARRDFTAEEAAALADVRVTRVVLIDGRAHIPGDGVRLPNRIADHHSDRGRDTVLLHGASGWQIDELGD